MNTINGKNFLNQYKGVIRSGSKMVVLKPLSFCVRNYAKYDYKEDFNSYHIYTEQVDAVEITMPVKEFERLVEEHDDFNELKKCTGIDSYKAILAEYQYLREKHWKQQTEKSIRDSNDSVKQAYENYQLLLNLAK